MSGTIEVEVKKEFPVSNLVCEFCEATATRTLQIGDVRGTTGQEYDVCGSPRCEKAALEKHGEILQDIWANRKLSRERDFLDSRGDK